MIIVKTKEQIEGIRHSCLLAKKTLSYLGELVKPGISTQKIDDLAVEFISDHHAIAAPLNYQGFPKSICTSINDVVCHGIPNSSDVLKDGDIVNIDVTTVLNGYYGDTSATFAVGSISPFAQKLLNVTRQSLDLAIKCLAPGLNLNQCVGGTIEPYVKSFGFSVVRELGGHGVGLQFHEDPFVYHFVVPKPDHVLLPGYIFTVEPMVNASSDHRVTLDRRDGWTIRTRDGSLSAQFEHTVLITPSGHQVLT